MALPELGEIERRRKTLGLTQNELAKRSGVSQSLIARVEAKTVDPRYSKVEKIFKAIDEFRQKETTAKEIMTTQVVGIQKDQTIKAAAAKMEKHGVSQLPVYDKKNIIGLLSEKTIRDRIAAGADAKKLSKEKIGATMQEAPPTVGPNTPLTAITKLLEHNTAVIVQEKGKTRGIITNADLLKTLNR